MGGEGGERRTVILAHVHDVYDILLSLLIIY